MLIRKVITIARPKKMLVTQEGHLTREQQEEKKIQEQIIRTGTEQLSKSSYMVKKFYG
ncbi:hypothetical protein [Clostridium sp. Marseille-Q7071]